MARPPGPIEQHEWPNELEARVITPGSNPHIFGYAVESDLARHYRFSDLVLLCLTGVLPDEPKSRVFEIALQFAAPLSVAESPTHAALLARICGARSSSIIAIAAVALSERARVLVASHARLLTWLDAPHPPLPPDFCACSDDDRDSVGRLQEALAPAGVTLPTLAFGPTRTAALFDAFYYAGMRTAEQLEPVFVLASLPACLSEAWTHRVAEFREYPIRLPRFRYEENP